MNKSNFHIPCLLMLIILVQITTSQGVESDISCLRFIKESLEDPLQSLSTWNFNNNSEGFICGFTGVKCWNLQKSRVISIELPNMGLTGPFPMGIRNCESIQNIDLSGNYLSGSIPSNLEEDLPYIVSLDLSNNNLSGSIPSSIAKCSFINTLRLDNNQLTGQIPQEFSKLLRLTRFSVANNRLSGPIPIFSGINLTEESYANNLELCGYPLTSCIKKELFADPLFFSGFLTGIFIFTFFSMVFMFVCWPRVRESKMSCYYISIKEIKGLKHRLTPGIGAAEISSEERKVTAMEKFTRPLSLVELETATNNFDNENIIGYGNRGIMYKAMFPNGLLLAVKRLHKFESFEKEFLLEIEILGRLRHTNLVPLLGFCNESEKKFLVYKYMSNGTLHHWLHSRPQVEAKKMGWPLRFKIATGIARGLAWLHHNNILRVTHLKISSRCILLDYDFEPKISKFSNAKMMVNASGTPLSSSTFVVPDCSPYKEDVYNFGILLLELVTGREPSTWINSLADRSREASMIDESLMGQGFDNEIQETLIIAEKCIQVQTDGEISMLQVYQAMCAIGTSSNEISADLCMNIEDN